jgi:hypothetical protein
MNSNLLKNLLSKLGDLPGRARAAMAGGDDLMAGAGKFRTGGDGGQGFINAGGGAARHANPNTERGIEMYRQPGGAISTEVQRMVPFDNIEKLKALLARMSPEQKAALMAGGAGLGAGGLGGYLAGDGEG